MLWKSDGFSFSVRNADKITNMGPWHKLPGPSPFYVPERVTKAIISGSQSCALKIQHILDIPKFIWL